MNLQVEGSIQLKASDHKNNTTFSYQIIFCFHCLVRRILYIEVGSNTRHIYAVVNIIKLIINWRYINLLDCN